MTRLAKFVRLPSADRRLLVAAALMQAAIRLGLALLPYRRVRGLVDRLARMSARRQPAPTASTERIAWAVTRASRSVPGAACLTRALAAKVLLERRGHPARVRVGIGRDEGAGLLAHAWVECDGRIVLGGTDLTQYTSLSLLEAEQPPSPRPSPQRGEGGGRSLDPLAPGGGEGQGEGERRLAR